MKKYTTIGQILKLNMKNICKKDKKKLKLEYEN